jgi:hypothetical protein
LTILALCSVCRKFKNSGIRYGRKLSWRNRGTFPALVCRDWQNHENPQDTGVAAVIQPRPSGYKHSVTSGWTSSVYINICHRSQDSSNGISTSYGHDGRGSIPGRSSIFSHSVQTGSGAHPVCYPMGTGGSFPLGKAAEAWSWPLTSI